MNIDNIEKRKHAPILTVEKIVKGDEAFFSDVLVKNDEEIMKRFLNQHPENTDKNIVIQKLRLIDLLNSTNLKMFNRKEEGLGKIEEALADAITDAKFENLNLIKEGVSSAVEYIAKAANERDKRFPCLYSFASKYCYYHQMYALEEPKNDYPIFDSNLCKILPEYITGISKNGLENVCKKHSYEKYKNIIETVFEVYKINKDDSRFENRAFSMLDHYLWYSLKIGNTILNKKS